MNGDVDPLKQQLNEKRDEMVLVREDTDGIVENVLFEGDGLQVRLGATAS